LREAQIPHARGICREHFAAAGNAHVPLSLIFTEIALVFQILEPPPMPDFGLGHDERVAGRERVLDQVRCSIGNALIGGADDGRERCGVLL
jgi:hypothetical protein